MANNFVCRRQIPTLGLFWQIIRILLLCNISIKQYPELVVLLKIDEKLMEFTNLPSEQILMRWMNYLLRRAGVRCNICSFSSQEFKVLLA
jgi:plastin-1